MRTSITCALLLLLVATSITACDSNVPTVPVFVTYDPPFNPATLQANITHTYFPLTPGTVWTYEELTPDGLERIVVEVLAETREVAGITTRVVHDQVFLNDDLIEDTFDWYAQDPAGNVWYLGEDSKEIQNGQVLNMAGSWEHGVNGAMAGIVMPASPSVGQAYQQEFYAGQAEDRGKVVGVNESVTIAMATYANCIRTEDTTPLDPSVLENKFYCPGVGTVLEVDLATGTRVELQAVETQ